MDRKLAVSVFSIVVGARREALLRLRPDDLPTRPSTLDCVEDMDMDMLPLAATPSIVGLVDVVVTIIESDASADGCGCGGDDDDD